MVFGHYAVCECDVNISTSLNDRISAPTNKKQRELVNVTIRYSCVGKMFRAGILCDLVNILAMLTTC